ncbi:MAG: ATP-binding protein [Phycisphaerales bacterium]|nr:MAG: ATP-binding protein [Phycisphaerales bacterium]
MDLLTGIVASIVAAIIVGTCVWAWRRFRKKVGRKGSPVIASPDTSPPVSMVPQDAPPVPAEAVPAEPTGQPVHGHPRDLLKSYPELQEKWVGRERELGELSQTWQAGSVRVFAVVGFGGEGKTALARRFVETARRQGDGVRHPVTVWWSFYFNRAADEFFTETLKHLGVPLKEDGQPLSTEQRATKLVDVLRTGVDGRPLLLILDGLEAMQDTTPGREGWLTDPGLQQLVRGMFHDVRPDTPGSGTILITTREALRSLKRESDPRFAEIALEELSVDDGVSLLTRQYGLEINREDAGAFIREVSGHALALTLTATLLKEAGATGVTLNELREFIAGEEARVTDPDITTRGKPGKRPHRLPGYILRHCGHGLSPQERQFMRLLSCCVRPATRRDIEEVFLQPIEVPEGQRSVNDSLAAHEYGQVRNTIIRHLRQLRLIGGNEDSGFDAHPLIRRHFYEEETGPQALTDDQRKVIHSRFYDILVDRAEKHHPDTLEEMRPLIDAVLHGCRAARADSAFIDLLYPRIHRMDDRSRTMSYLAANLGATETALELTRTFFPGGEFTGDPTVSDERRKAWLVGTAALMLLATGRPSVAVTLFARGLAMRRAQSDWANASMNCQNLCESYVRLGHLHEAARAAADALDYVGRLPKDHHCKRGYTQFSHGYTGTIAALRGDDTAAMKHLSAALEAAQCDWLASIDGGWHCTWLAQRGEFDRARSAAERNVTWCGRHGGLHSQTFALRTQGLVERLAWRANDPNRRSLDEMYSHAVNAVEVGRRSGHHPYLTYALLGAGRCAVTRAKYEPDRREEFVAEADRYLAEAEDRAQYAEYRLIQADTHVARAELAKLTGDEQKMREHCEQAIAICDDPACGYAWAKQDAEALLSESRQ